MTSLFLPPTFTPRSSARYDRTSVCLTFLGRGRLPAPSSAATAWISTTAPGEPTTTSMTSHRPLVPRRACLPGTLVATDRHRRISHMGWLAWGRQQPLEL